MALKKASPSLCILLGVFGLIIFSHLQNFIKKRGSIKSIAFELKNIGPQKVFGEEIDILMYIPNKKILDKELELLIWLFNFSDFMKIGKELNNATFTYYETPYIRVVKNDNIIVMDQPEGSNNYKIIITSENLKTIINEWEKLQEKNCPEIYFIQKDDGTIVVREKLEE